VEKVHWQPSDLPMAAFAVCGASFFVAAGGGGSPQDFFFSFKEEILSRRK
jgi:hypothetical protein